MLNSTETKYREWKISLLSRLTLYPENELYLPFLLPKLRHELNLQALTFLKGFKLMLLGEDITAHRDTFPGCPDGWTIR